MKNFDFDKDTSENSFPQPYMSYMANERLQGEGQFHSKSYLLKMLRCHAKMRLKSALQKLNFVIAKAISECYTLDCACFFYKQHFHKQHQADIGNKLSKS